MIWINVLLLFSLLTFPALLWLNKHILKGKNKAMNAFIKKGRRIHPYIGITVIVLGALHGYSMLGGQFMFHTGSLLLLLFIANGILGFAYKKKKDRKLSKLHQAFGLLILLTFALHYLNPWFFS